MPELATVVVALGWAIVAFVVGAWMYAKKEKQLAELL
jgi:ABC-type polysaccharide/polyol phosphate export permease